MRELFLRFGLQPSVVWRDWTDGDRAWALACFEAEGQRRKQQQTVAPKNSRGRR